ncbi:GAF domain-containing protein [Nocardioides caldifontis]|uniref:sensor histidine kinase n=1 Tax=Nocardioides caldifontis TaxID=2588938 RepID=UPI0011DF0EEC|nr:GAF domain-containing protein [Nocardioides caldifontis]
MRPPPFLRRAAVPEGLRQAAALEMAAAFIVGAGWFAAVTVLLAKPLPESAATAVAVITLDVVVVLLTARYWDIPYAVTVGVASVVALDWYFIPPTHALELPDARNSLALVTYLLMASLLGELAVRARRTAVEAESARAGLAEEQAALRRVATIVARQPPPEAVFAAVTEEIGRQLGADVATLSRFNPDGTASVVASWSASGPSLEVGWRYPLEGLNVTGEVFRTGRGARVDSFQGAAGSWAATLRQLGVRSAAGCPITVDGSVWGAVVVASRSTEPVDEAVETRLSDFTDLIATAIDNAQARVDLLASRTRLVAAADEARRRIERDLHDGVQQRLVSLALGVRLVRDDAADGADVVPRLDEISTALTGTLDELRELSRGIHPAILTEGGLRPALAVLARRSAVPVELEVGDIGRLPSPVEVGVYYVTSEALTNVAKHARASVVRVTLRLAGSVLELRIDDDGVGGADRDGGSGLTGLEDRVQALGGRLELTSPPGAGTTLVATFPVLVADSAAPGEDRAEGRA